MPRIAIHTTGYTLALLLLMCSPLFFGSCTYGVVYSASADIDVGGWRAADSAHFVVDVVDVATPSTPATDSVDYRLRLGVRYTTAFPANDLRLRFLVAVLDSADRPSRPLYRQTITIPIVDADGDWRNRSWGSLMQTEYRVEPLRLRFPAAGRYRITLFPERESDGTDGVASLSLTIER